MLFSSMLPTEILALIFIASGAHAIPQTWSPIILNSTSTPTTSTPLLSSQMTPAPTTLGEITATSSEEDPPFLDCTQVMCSLFPVQFELPSETGFEKTSATSNGKTVPTGSTRLKTTVIRPTTNNNVITSSTLLVVVIKTNIAPTAVNNPPPLTDGQPAPSGEQPGPSAPKASSSNPLLTEIISLIARPDPRPSNPSNNQIAPNDENPQQMQHGTAALAPEPSITPTPGAQPTLQLGQSMTIAGAILTLTPGLSTTVDEGPAATYIAITSDAAGHTVITISSSGTAVTATVADAPTTLSMTSTVETSVTGVHGPASLASSTTRAPASTSSKAGAVDKWDGNIWIVHIVVCILGLGAAL